MIQEFVDKFISHKHEIMRLFSEKHPDSYMEIVKVVVSILHDPKKYKSIDPERIHQIDDGDYQGTLVFVIASSGYQPDEYWYVKVSYGSCSGCDTLEGIRGYGSGNPTADQVSDYYTLALHVVQGIKRMGSDTVY